MIPLYDTNTRKSFPFINYLIIGVNIFVFVLQLMAVNVDAFITTYAFIPARFSFINPATFMQIFTSMWLHGGFLHIISNMWFLHIFGDNVEDRLGHFRYIFFYVTSGIAAVAAQYIISPASSIPLIGASGAIAGVTGAYFLLFRRSRVVALVPSFFGFWHRVELPSWIFLGYWFVLQIISGFGSLAAAGSDKGGVAFFAHIGGFVCGYVLALLMRSDKNSEEKSYDDGYEKLERLYN